MHAVAVVRILGIDPGTTVVGFACVEVSERARVSTSAASVPLAQRAGNVVRLGGGGGPCALVEAGALKLGRTRAIPARLHTLRVELDQLLERLQPTELALEEAFFGKSVQSALRVGEARGVVLAGAHRAGLEIHQYPPARIKRSVTGSGRADKETVAAVAAQQLGLRAIEGPRDVSDALATALCRVEERRGFTL